jgi:hypothetical protein
VRLAAAPPAGCLAPEQEQRDEGHGDGPFAAVGRARYILRFRLGCKKSVKRVPWP